MLFQFFFWITSALVLFTLEAAGDSWRRVALVGMFISSGGYALAARLENNSYRQKLTNLLSTLRTQCQISEHVPLVLTEEVVPSAMSNPEKTKARPQMNIAERMHVVLSLLLGGGSLRSLYLKASIVAGTPGLIGLTLNLGMHSDWLAKAAGVSLSAGGLFLLSSCLGDEIYSDGNRLHFCPFCCSHLSIGGIEGTSIDTLQSLWSRFSATF